jgi:hypothetical protein
MLCLRALMDRRLARVANAFVIPIMGRYVPRLEWANWIREGPERVRHGSSLALQECPEFAARADTQITSEKCHDQTFDIASAQRNAKAVSAAPPKVRTAY